MKAEPCISVIVPSFNRAHLLLDTIPSYLQEDVLELILVDDCSSDNTIEVVKELMAIDSRIKYVRNKINSKQAFAKNVGIQMAKGRFFYFGDDDSVISKETLSILLKTMMLYDADIVGARSLNAGNYFTLKSLDAYVNWMTFSHRTSRGQDICNLERMFFDFSFYIESVIDFPVCHAPFLVKSSVARSIFFDDKYKGCAYREETDFLIRATLMGFKIIYQSKAVQINLPRIRVGNTGASSEGFEKWKASAIECNDYFLKKNWPAIVEKYGYRESVDEMQRAFVKEMNRRTSNGFQKKSLLKKLLYYMVIEPFFKNKKYY